MSIKLLDESELQTLVDSRHATVGITYPTRGLQPYYVWLLQSLHQLAETSAAAIHVSRDDTNPTSIHIAPGRLSLDGDPLLLDEQTVDLAVHNNATAAIWVEVGTSNAVVGFDDLANGWPTGTHLKIAEVTLEAGQITSIVDRRFEAMLSAGDIRLRSYNDASRPAAGLVGRLIFNTDDGQINVDTGTAWTLTDGSAT